MSKKQNIKQELEELDSPILAQWQGKSQDWPIPEGYIKGLADKVVTASLKEKNVAPWRFNKPIIWQLAATLLFILAGAWMFLNFQATEILKPLANLEDISTEEIEAYILKNIDDFDVELLEEYALAAGFETPLQLDNEIWDNDPELEADWFEENMDVDLF